MWIAFWLSLLIIPAGIMAYDAATNSGFADLVYPSKPEPEPVATSPYSLVFQTDYSLYMNEEDYRCNEWGHAGRNIAWCPNPWCPSPANQDAVDTDETEILD